MGTIYQVINRQTGDKYIGRTTIPINKRWLEHIQLALRMSSQRLHKAMREYNNHNFLIREICDCRDEELEEKQLQYIQELNGIGIEGYENITIEEKPIQIKEPEKPKKKGFMDNEKRGDGKLLSTKVLSVNVETGEETEWDSISDAAIALTGDKRKTGNIVRAMNKGYKAYGHLWKRLEKSKQYVKIYGVHKITWQRTQIFNSIKEAARCCNGDYNCIRRSVNNPRKYSYKGFYWFRV